MSKSKKKKRKKNLQKVIVVLLCLVMIFAGLSIGLIVSHFIHPRTDSNNDTLYDIRSNQTTDSETLSDNTIIPCFDNMTMKANQLNQSVSFYNPPSNDGVYFNMVLSLEDGTILYESQPIPPGKALYDITLNKELAAGLYKANLTYNCSTASGTALNGTTLDFDLQMED